MQLYGVGRLVRSVISQLQLQLEQSLHPGQLQVQKQKNETKLKIMMQTKSNYYIFQSLQKI